MAKQISECCTCGHTWATGQDGSHSCVRRLEGKIQIMEAAMKTFVERVDNGSIRSKKTYAQFKNILGIE